MSDLIRRSKAISVLKQLDEHSLSGKMDISNAIYLLENQPDAYDIGKVVAELEERTDFLKDCTKYGNKNAKQQAESYNTMMMYEVADLVDDLIEIVRQGGVDDDVCEWESDYKIVSDKYKRVTGCGYEFYDLHHAVAFKFCPYCGKKIMIVGD